MSLIRNVKSNHAVQSWPLWVCSLLVGFGIGHSLPLTAGNPAISGVAFATKKATKKTKLCKCATCLAPGCCQKLDSDECIRECKSFKWYVEEDKECDEKEWPACCSNE